MTSTLFFSVRNQVNSMENVKMLKSKTNQKLFALISVALLLSLAIVVNSASALLSQSTTSWFWTSDTNASAMVLSDVNNDTQTELVTVGYFHDGLRWNSQLVVWNASTLVAEKLTTWYWTNDTQVSSVATGDVNGDGQVEIITGGAFFDSTRWNAQLIVWNGTSLAAEKVVTWFWTNNTEVASVAVANITGGIGLDIVTGGSFFDGTRWNAQLVIWNGSTLGVEQVKTWYWTSNTYINSLAVANISNGPSLSIVTGGAFNDGLRSNAQLVVWNASTLAVQSLTSWYWTSDTDINSVAVANITGGTALSIVTGGSYFDGTRFNGQLIIWNSQTLAVQTLTNWFTTSNTNVASVAVGNFSGGANLDVVTGGTFSDGVRNNGQVAVWNGNTLVATSVANWFVTSNTQVNSVGIANYGAVVGKRIVAAGQYFDGTRAEGSLTVWG
jgi:hypothetical protein